MVLYTDMDLYTQITDIPIYVLHRAISSEKKTNGYTILDQYIIKKVITVESMDFSKIQ